MILQSKATSCSGSNPFRVPCILDWLKLCSELTLESCQDLGSDRHENRRVHNRMWESHLSHPGSGCWTFGKHPECQRWAFTGPHCEVTSPSSRLRFVANRHQYCDCGFFPCGLAYIYNKEWFYSRRSVSMTFRLFLQLKQKRCENVINNRTEQGHIFN